MYLMAKHLPARRSRGKSSGAFRVNTESTSYSVYFLSFPLSIDFFRPAHSHNPCQTKDPTVSGGVWHIPKSRWTSVGVYLALGKTAHTPGTSRSH